MKRKDLNRIRETVVQVEKQPRNQMPDYVAAPSPGYRGLGVTTAQINAGNHGTVTEYYLNPASGTWSATGATLTVWNYFSSNIATSTKVIFMWIAGGLHIIAVDCTT